MTITPTFTNGRLKEMVEELDDYVRDNDVTELELNFIGDLFGKTTFSFKQKENIIRLWEKYCV